MPTSNRSQTQQDVPTTYLPTHGIEEEIDIFGLWRVLMSGKWLILFFTVLFTAVAIYIALTTIPIYRAEVLLEPVVEEGKKSGGLLNRYGGLAAMAGINLGQGGGSQETALAKLQSRIFIETFIKDEKLLPVIFYKVWNPQTKAWKVEDPTQTPTMWNGVEYFRRDVLSVSGNKETGLMFSYSPL